MLTLFADTQLLMYFKNIFYHKLLHRKTIVNYLEFHLQYLDWYHGIMFRSIYERFRNQENH